MEDHEEFESLWDWLEAEDEIERESQPEIPWTLRVPLGWPKNLEQHSEAVRFRRSQMSLLAQQSKTRNNHVPDPN